MVPGDGHDKNCANIPHTPLMIGSPRTLSVERNPEMLANEKIAISSNSIRAGGKRVT